jgi:hypothetical protein
VRLASLSVLDSLIVCHPELVSEAEVKAINVGTSVLLSMVRAYRCYLPITTSWVCAEGQRVRMKKDSLCLLHESTEDICFGPAIRNKAEALLAAREGKNNFVDYEFVDYKGMCYLIHDCYALLFTLAPFMDLPAGLL